MILGIDKSAWQRVPFGAVVRNLNETVKDPAAAAIDRVVAMEHMDPGELQIKRSGDAADGTTFTRRVRPRQTLFGKRRAYQRKVAYAEFDAICSGDIYTFEADETRMLGEFLPFLVQSDRFFDHALDTSAGSLSPRTNWRDLANFEFELPPLNEQKRIADLLWAIEGERRTAGMLRTALQDARDVARDELLEKISAPAHTFESICSIPSQNGVTLKKSERAGTTPMVNMGEMFKGEVISISTGYERVLTPAPNFLLEPGDLLFARRSIVFEGAGACCLVPSLSEAYTFESSVIRSRVRGDVDPSFVLHFFRSARGRQVMSQIVRRGPVSGISGSDLRKLEIPVPEIDVQRAIVQRIESISTAVPRIDERRQRAGLLAAAVMAEIFGGN